MAGSSALRRALWAVCACALLLAPRADASGRALTADFDGDGTADWVAIDRVEPSILHIWLSTTGTAAVIHSRLPVLEIAARDVDGDHQPELIATQAAPRSVRTLGRSNVLHVWKQDGRRGFRSYRPRRGPPRQIAAPCSRTVSDEEPADDSTEGLAGASHGNAFVVATERATAPLASSLTAATQSSAAATPGSRNPAEPRGPPALRLA